VVVGRGMENAKREKNLTIEDFPQVFKMGNLLQVVYRNRSELYSLTNKYNDSGENEDGSKKPFDPYNEIDMIKGNGGKRIHGNKEIRFIVEKEIVGRGESGIQTK